MLERLGKEPVPDLNIILDALPHAVLVVDSGGNIRFANALAENIFQASSSYLCKKQLVDFLPKNSSVLSMLVRAHSNHVAVNDYEIDISSPRNGDGVIVNAHVAPISESDDLYLITLRARGLAEKIDRQLNHQSAARSVTGLASMLAHEIKNPLSGIRGAAQLLESTATDDEKELTGLITGETDRIVRLVDRMEIFSDESPIERGPVNLHSILGNIRRISKNGFAKHCTFKEMYDPSLPHVSGNSDQLVQVFMNLIKNAAEAISETDDPHIKIASAYRSGIHLQEPASGERASLPLEFTVSDNGPGIPSEIRNHIFEPFVSSKINGSGLGLALVAKIIGRHGGVIGCDSDERGTTFRILLPAWTDEKTERSDDG
jgi:two-component system nitrogen regulation sensor histidine kinase GlnL